MHPIKAFKTSDGRIFASESDAAHHEVKTEMVSWFKEQGLDKGAFSVGELVRVMLKDSAHFALLLTGHARAQPRCPAGLEGIIVQRLKAQPLRINGTATSHQAKNGSSLGYVQESSKRYAQLPAPGKSDTTGKNHTTGNSHAKRKQNGHSVSASL